MIVDKQLQIDISKFKKERCATIPRYISKPDAEVTSKVRHQKNK